MLIDKLNLIEMLNFIDRVETVKSYFRKWMKEFPDIQTLANSSAERVKEMWAGLGYYRRASLLHKCAQTVVEKFGGKLPEEAEELEKLPGIGKYTAGAISSVAFGKVTPVVDGNVIRVLTRLRAIATDPKGSAVTKLMWKIAGDLVDDERPGDFNQAIMELGSQLCTALNPHCDKCPVRKCCNAHKEVISSTKYTEHGDYDPCTLCTVHDITTTVTKFPIKTAKKKKRELMTQVCIVQKDNGIGELEYLLVQRPDKGLLAGFWEFPSVELEDANEDTPYDQRKEVMDLYLSKLDQTIVDNHSERRELGTTTHIFTHINQLLFVETLRIKNSSQESFAEDFPTEITYNWFTKDTLMGMAISKSVKKCFSLLCKDEKPKPAPKRTKLMRKQISNDIKAQDAINKMFNISH